MVSGKNLVNMYLCVKSVQIQSFFLPVFSCIRTEYEDLRSNSPYSVRIQENTDQKKLRIWTLFTQCTPKDLVTYSLLVCMFSINRSGQICRGNFLFERRWNDAHLVLPTFKDNLLDLNHAKTL